MSKIKNIFLINLIIFFILIIILELILGNKLYPNKLNCSYLLCSVNHIYKNDLYKGKNFIKYSKDKYGFRGLRKDVDKIDILVIGGSTTDERYIELEDTWTEQLEIQLNNFYPSLNFDVVNAGIDGQSSIGHIWNFENWFPKIRNFKTKYIFFYIGLNEYFSKEKDGSDNLYKNKSIFQKMKFWLKENNGLIYKSYNLIYHKFFLEDNFNVGHKIRDNNYQIAETDHSINKNNIEELNFRLNKLIKLTKELNSIPVFITQKTFRYKIINNKVFSIDKFNYFLHEKKIAEVITNNCKKNQIICIDLFSKIEFVDSDFYDLVHTNPVGSKKIAKFIFNESAFIVNNN